ncbi:MAG: DUF502 domain-containing protein [Pirellulales bacterium]|jgi:uncharacterized membrane protein|nr:DUF502 domain-containing protein [Thermoguttaceae bacterium]MDD4787445.1 DUF502 domain-containing protein [Pirellulales bacterium]MDI9444187.1 DUF502 domain-containing protein [Planctomycetota bacterium]NLZ01851.1 DUF502 domain-containing protein [Pirellulaceae bacterium]
MKRGQDETATRLHPFRTAVLRGLGVALPPLLTIGIFIWAGRFVYENLAAPVISLTTDYIGVKPVYAIPCILSLFLLVLYLLGKFVAVRLGWIFWTLFERGIDRVPLVRNVYGAVKQVSDFVLSEREIEYSRVVAVEWPRRGIWSLALVTSESMVDIEAAANEPVLAVLIPTSPMPMTGFTLTIKKSEAIDLNITFDEAIQFVVSCGVVIPPKQLRRMTTGEPGLAASTRAAAAPEDALDISADAAREAPPEDETL